MADPREPHEYGRALMAPLRAEPLSPALVDIAAATHIGRQRRRRRQLGLAGSAALAVAALVGATTLIIGPAPGEPAPPPAATAPQTTAPAAVSFGPLRQTLTVTPPDPFRIRTEATSNGVQTISLSAGALGNAYVALFETGRSPLPDGAQTEQPGRPIDPVKGQAAYRGSCAGAAGNTDAPPAGIGDGVNCAIVYWHWRPDAWASVFVDLYPAANSADSTDEALAYALALAANTAAVVPDFPVRAPIRVTTPADLPLVGVITHDSGRVDLLLGRGDIDPTAERTDTMAIVSVRNDLPVDSAATGRVNGHRASIEDTEVTIYHVVGEWSLRVTSQPENLFGDGAALLAFARSVEFVADPDDLDSWVSPVG